MVNVLNNSNITNNRFLEIEAKVEGLKGLRQAVEWAATEPLGGKIPEVVTQDEFTHDVIFKYGELFVVFDTT